MASAARVTTSAPVELRPPITDTTAFRVSLVLLGLAAIVALRYLLFVQLISPTETSLGYAYWLVSSILFVSGVVLIALYERRRREPLPPPP